jgi:hypothetical protein
MTRGAPSQRYGVAQAADGSVFVIAKGSMAILKAVKECPGITYPEIVERTGHPLPSLMVFARRLEVANLAKRVKKHIDGRSRTTMELQEGVNIDFDVTHI